MRPGTCGVLKIIGFGVFHAQRAGVNFSTAAQKLYLLELLKCLFLDGKGCIFYLIVTRLDSC